MDSFIQTIQAFFFYSPYWIIVLPGILLGLYAYQKLLTTYQRYARVPTQQGITGAEAARRILDAAGLFDVAIEMIPGSLTDHYDPVHKVLRLSEENYRSRSIAAVGVAAHEAGHALQHQAGYAFFQLRMAVVPVTQFATQMAAILASIGFMLLIFGILSPALFVKLLPVIIIGYGAATLFQMITLPVEYDASRRAAVRLQALGIIDDTELPAVKQVLHAAALTYVAALVTAVLELLQWILIFRGFSDE